MPIERDALLVDQRHGRRRAATAPRRGSVWVCGGGLRQRVRAGRPGEVVEAQPQHDRAAHAVGGAHPPGDAVDQRDQRGVDRVRRSAGRGRARAASRSSRRRRPTCTGRGSRLWASAWRCRPEARPEHARRAPRSARRGDLADGARCPRSCSLPAVTGPTPQSRSTGSGCRNASSPSGGTTSRPSGLATPLATLARNLVRATPTVIGQPDPFPAPRAAAAPRSPPACPRPAAARRRRGTPRRSRSLDQRRGVARRPRTPPCWPRSRRTCGAATTIARGHSRRASAPPIAVRTPKRLGLVAGGEHDPPPPTMTGRPRRRGSSRCSTEA